LQPSTYASTIQGALLLRPRLNNSDLQQVSFCALFPALIFHLRSSQHWSKPELSSLTRFCSYRTLPLTNH
jgi:hypothetical protein